MRECVYKSVTECVFCFRELGQHVTGASHADGHVFDMISIHGARSIIKGTPVNVDPHLCDGKGNQCGDCLSSKVTIPKHRTTEKRFLSTGFVVSPSQTS